ncbi:MAG: rRNA maturation RNase YbeY, partial [Myxococcales bacterium]|nr:rRNA maturation RNase YbeY [Myxococcales bacterium]
MSAAPSRRPSRRATPVAHVVRVSVAGGPFAGVRADVLRRRAHKMLLALARAPTELSVARGDGAALRDL